MATSGEQAVTYFTMPGVDLLGPMPLCVPADRTLLHRRASDLEDLLKRCGAAARVVQIRLGPVFTSFMIELAPGVRFRQIVGFAEDIAIALRCTAVDVMSRPGDALVAVQAPNDTPQAVVISELIASDTFMTSTGGLPVALGKDVLGDPVTIDLVELQHLLVTGQTATGKTGAVHAILQSLLFRFGTARLWLQIYGAKLTDYATYGDIPHLLEPIGSQTVPLLFLILAAAGLAVGLTIVFIRAGMRPGAWFRVGPDGFDYGTGSEDSDIARGAGDRIEWKRVVPNPERPFDIGTASEVYRVAPAPRMTFWYREDNSLIAERTLPLQLRTDALRCLRFYNSHAVRVALLRRLAANTTLRFDPEVFVKAGVDPETWQPMPGPGRTSWIAALLTTACLLGFAALGGDWSPAWLAIGAVLIFCGGLLLYVRYWPRAYPRLTGVITFRARS